jgi:hypothetical protein
VRAASAKCFGDLLELIRRAAKRNKGAAAWLRKTGDVAAAILRDLEDPEGEDDLEDPERDDDLEDPEGDDHLEEE